jgi:hypothetical protein
MSTLQRSSQQFGSCYAMIMSDTECFALGRRPFARDGLRPGVQSRTPPGYRPERGPARFARADAFRIGESPPER